MVRAMATLAQAVTLLLTPPQFTERPIDWDLFRTIDANGDVETLLKARRKP
jgi:hypothetical protein